MSRTSSGSDDVTARRARRAATTVRWGAGDGPGEHVNDERDVLVFLVDGSAKITVDGEARDLRRGEGLIVAKGSLRKITAGRDGARYLSVHLRRPPLQIEPHLTGA